MKVTPSAPLCVCQKGIKLHHTRAERKVLYFCNFIFQSQAFSCIRLSINLGSCNFDLFTLCLQHILQSHFLLNGLHGIEEPSRKKKTSTGFLFLFSFLKKKKKTFKSYLDDTFTCEGNGYPPSLHCWFSKPLSAEVVLFPIQQQQSHHKSHNHLRRSSCLSQDIPF